MTSACHLPQVFYVGSADQIQVFILAQEAFYQLSTQHPEDGF